MHDTPNTPDQPLTFQRLRVAEAAAKRRFDSIQNKYPAIKASLVISSPRGQANLHSSAANILHDFPAAVIDDPDKAPALRLLSQIAALEEADKKDPKIEPLKEQLDRRVASLRYDANCRIELRFADLDYALIHKLRSDDLVDHALTPQTNASIRIVLGTMAHFEKMPRPVVSIKPPGRKLTQPIQRTEFHL